MSYPVKELLAQKLKARLETVTIANGYNQNVAKVVRPTRMGGYTPEDRLIVLEQGDPKQIGSTEGANGMLEWMQPFFLELYIRPSDKDATPVDTKVNMFAADVHKAIAAPNNWHAWDGLAVNTFFREPSDFAAAEGEHEGIELQIDIQYRTDERDPYTAR